MGVVFFVEVVLPGLGGGVAEVDTRGSRGGGLLGRYTCLGSGKRGSLRVFHGRRIARGKRFLCGVGFFSFSIFNFFPFSIWLKWWSSAAVT